MANAITKAITFFKGKLIGQDSCGNLYYQERKQPALNKRQKRWVIYAKNGSDASLVPSSHYNWLHHTSDEFPLSEGLKYDWQKPHQHNLTGTKMAYRPAGHVYKGGVRPKATGDYEAWKP